MQRPYIIAIEGNIGAGKTTIIKAFSSKTQFLNTKKEYICITEPVSRWETIRDTKTNENILSRFYENPSKYSFPFQVMAFITRKQQIHEEINKIMEMETQPIIITERSLMADKQVFAKMLYDDNMIEDIMYQIYNLNYDDPNLPLADAVIYLKATPTNCLERVNKRNREGETKISLEYLEKCEKYYEEWLLKEAKPILVLDVNTNIEREHYIKIEEFINSLQKPNTSSCNSEPRLWSVFQNIHHF